MKYKILYSGYAEIDVEAESKEEAEDIFWEEGHNELFDSKIEEIVEVGEPLKQHTDFN